MTKNIHVARYSATLSETLDDAMYAAASNAPNLRWLDCCGGDGREFARLCIKNGVWPYAVEIEPAYVKRAHPCVQLGDSTDLQFPDDFFGGAMTSVVYPNGMADNFHSNEDSKRLTYIHVIREFEGQEYELHPNNAAGMNPRRSAKAMASFMAINLGIYEEVFRTLAPGACFIINTKNTPQYEFTSLTHEQLAGVGFEFRKSKDVEVLGMNFGANQDKKETFETVAMFTKPVLIKENQRVSEALLAPNQYDSRENTESVK